MVTQERAGVDVGRAAELLGVPVAAVRKRARRGSLQAWKIDGEWRIAVPADECGTSHGIPTDERIGRATGPDTGHPSGEPAGLDAGHAALIDELRSEVAFLRQLTEHQAGVIATLSAQIPALPPAPEAAGRAEGAEKPPATAEPVQTASAPARGFWARLFGR
jgi:hypothetical protein